MKAHPLIWPALGLLAGIHLGAQLGEAWFYAACALGMCLLLGAAGYVGFRIRLSPLMGLVFFFLGAALIAGSLAKELPPDHVAAWADSRKHELILDAARAAEPRPAGHYLLARVVKVDGRRAQGLLRLSLGPKVSPPRPGERFFARVRLRPIKSFANPGWFDYRAFMFDKGVVARAFSGRRNPPAVLGRGEVNLWRVWLESLRLYVSQRLLELEPGKGRALLRALILGQRGELGSRARDYFGKTGTAHLLAISGLHLAMVWGLSFFLLRVFLALIPGLALKWGAVRPAMALAFLPCAMYAALAGASLPTLRALIMLACLASAFMLNRPYRAMGGLALAALVIGIAWPRAVLGLSFRLSFIAVASILLAAAPMAERFKRKGPGGKAVTAVYGWLTVSLVVSAAVWPVSVLEFHALPLATLAANAMLTPLVTMMALPLGLLGAGLCFIWPGAAAWVWGLAAGAADLAVHLAGFMAVLPGAVLYVKGPGPWLAAGMYLAALGLTLFKGGMQKISGAVLFLMLVASLGALPPLWGDSVLRDFRGRHVGPLTVWFLDVGHGSCAVARTPQGRVLVVDGGGWPGSDFDFGRNVVAPFLWSRGIRRVDALACSHPDVDHVKGLLFLARWFAPKELWTNGDGLDGKDYGALLALAGELGIKVRTPADLASGFDFGGARVDVLWPGRLARSLSLRDNERSLWLRLSLGKNAVHLPGDASPKVERMVAGNLEPMGGLEFLAAPHHGGSGSCSKKLLGRIRPRAVVVSADLPGRFARPGKAVLERTGLIPVLPTWRFGCLMLNIERGGKTEIKAFLKEPREQPMLNRSSRGRGGLFRPDFHQLYAW